jgi:hypothetical protein
MNGEVRFGEKEDKSYSGNAMGFESVAGNIQDIEPNGIANFHDGLTDEL